MGLSEKTVQIVKATAKPVAENGEAITIKMYEVLFEKYPETKILFKDATSDQHKKLAGAVSAYAANIDNLSVLNKAIEKMVEAHIKTNIQPEHYPIPVHHI